MTLPLKQTEKIIIIMDLGNFNQQNYNNNNNKLWLHGERSLLLYICKLLLKQTENYYNNITLPI